MKKITGLLLPLFIFCGISAQKPPFYKNFSVSVYARAYEVRDMADQKKLQETWDLISRQVRIDKIYLETHRDKLIVDEKTLASAIKFFKSKGLTVAGGITYTIDESNNFETFCYSNPEHRAMAKEIAEYTAKHFDEFILDDFFFTSCKCDLCVKAKGDMSWTDFRLKLMTDAARDLIINPAKAVNPKVKIVIKYPNWYEHFQGLGFNLEDEPKMFDGIYTGTETRDAVSSDQHLQQYESYLIFRYFENIAPGRNGGGWVDSGGASYLDRYTEQFWLTLFAKAPEITMFDWRQLQSALRAGQRGAWQGTGTSFDFDEMIKPYKLADGTEVKPSTIARAAAVTFEQVDKFIGQLGNPVGLKSYRPYHSTGEDFLQNYLGMIGIPMDLCPEFPEDVKMILLTESAKYDPAIVQKIRRRIQSGKNVMITSGLLRALQGKGIEDIAEITYTDRKALVSEFKAGWGKLVKSSQEILIPQINYLTNDSWEEVSAIQGATGWPLLHRAQYSKGYLYVLTIPENFSDLYQYPPEVLNRIRSVASQGLNLRLEGPTMVSLFLYDNGTFIVESFLPESVTVRVVTGQKTDSIEDLLSGETITGTVVQAFMARNRQADPERSFEITVKPHSYRVFRLTGSK
ncbi:MAG TPA: hypothetical protein PLL94_03010 [Bacteroidales bacterium]|jgi:hypothetical protein|nr:MAG: hypothetical protein BWX96_02036 [Bacteroidetes bacterium ADurb.Bin145]HOU02369.1 hypothetical protein [Bacteroidales bacterium]HQK67094.1 hypothetical protein [Bacteroidales bacterium]